MHEEIGQGHTDLAVQVIGSLYHKYCCWWRNNIILWEKPMHIKNSGHCTEVGIQYINVCSMTASDLSHHKILSVMSGLWVDEFYKLRLQILQSEGDCQVQKSLGNGKKPVSGSFSGASVMEQEWCEGSRSTLSSASIYTGSGMGVAGHQGSKRIILTPLFST